MPTTTTAPAPFIYEEITCPTCGVEGALRLKQYESSNESGAHYCTACSDPTLGWRQFRDVRRDATIFIDDNGCHSEPQADQRYYGIELESLFGSNMSTAAVKEKTKLFMKTYENVAPVPVYDASISTRGSNSVEWVYSPATISMLGKNFPDSLLQSGLRLNSNCGLHINYMPKSKAEEFNLSMLIICVLQKRQLTRTAQTQLFGRKVGDNQYIESWGDIDSSNTYTHKTAPSVFMKLQNWTSSSEDHHKFISKKPSGLMEFRLPKAVMTKQGLMEQLEMFDLFVDFASTQMPPTDYLSSIMEAELTTANFSDRFFTYLRTNKERFLQTHLNGITKLAQHHDFLNQ